jgi:hypothetical protein
MVGPIEGFFEPAPQSRPASASLGVGSSLHSRIWSGELTDRELGKKAHQLLKLQEVDFGPEVQIPALFPLTHREIYSYLEKHFPKLPTLWEEFLAEKSMTPRAKEVLSEIRKGILGAFLLYTFSTVELEKFLREHPRSLLAVRSTGAEDGEDEEGKGIVNAGGNESKVSIRPMPKEISKAVGEVIASYFSEKSLEQRIIEGDKIDCEIFVPVFVQVMVGERKDTSPTVSGVMFSREAEGKTPGVTHIQATYGHNSVVDGSAPFDSFYCYSDGVNHSVVVNKEYKIISVEQGDGSYKLEKVYNHPEDRKVPVLPDTVLERLKDIAKVAGEDMDIEWVYDLETNIIHIVQIRPIIHPTITPLTLEAESPEGTHSIAASPIGAGGGRAVVVTDMEEELIEADTLAQALDILRTKDPKKIKLVVVSKMVPATSHEATTFRGQGIAVFCLSDLSEFEKWKEEGYPIVADPQRKKVVQISIEDSWLGLDSMIATQRLIDEGSLVGKWVKFPLPLRKTLVEKIERVCPELVRAPYIKSLHGKSIRELLEHDVSWEQEYSHKMAALGVILQKLYKKQEKYSSPHLAERMERVFCNALQVVRDIAHSEDQMKHLLSVHWLETILYQEMQEDLVGGDSMCQVLQEDKASQKAVLPPLRKEDLVMIEQLAKLDPEGIFRSKRLSRARAQEYLTQYLKVQKLIINDDLSESWKNFVSGIVRSRSYYHNGRLAKIVYQLQQMNMTSSWLHTEFAKIWKGTGGNLASCLSYCEQSLEQAKEIMDLVREKRKTLQVWQNKIGEWENPEDFTKLWRQFREEFLPIIYDERLKDLLTLKPSSDVGEKCILQLVADVTECLDLTIKSMKGSSLYTDKQQQVENFVMILQEYLFFMEQWVSVIPEEQWEKLSGDSQKMFLQCIRGVFATLKESPLPILLYPSGSFSVEAACVGSKTDPERHIVNTMTLEDMFTLVHQNLLRTVSVLNTSQASVISLLPEQVQKVDRMLQKKMEKAYKIEGEKKCYRVQVKDDYPNINILYNLPLRQHSITLQLKYNRQLKTLELHCKCFGHNEGGRMQRITDLFNLSHLLGDFRVAQPPRHEPNKYTLEFAWDLTDISSDGRLGKVQECLGMMGDASMVTEYVDRQNLMWRSSFCFDENREANTLLENIGARGSPDELIRQWRAVREANPLLAVYFVSKIIEVKKNTSRREGTIFDVDALSWDCLKEWVFELDDSLLYCELMMALSTKKGDAFDEVVEKVLEKQDSVMLSSLITLRSGSRRMFVLPTLPQVEKILRVALSSPYHEVVCDAAEVVKDSYREHPEALKLFYKPFLERLEEMDHPHAREAVCSMLCSFGEDRSMSPLLEEYRDSHDLKKKRVAASVLDEMTGYYSHVELEREEFTAWVESFLLCNDLEVCRELYGIADNCLNKGRQDLAERIHAHLLTIDDEGFLIEYWERCLSTRKTPEQIMSIVEKLTPSLVDIIEKSSCFYYTWFERVSIEGLTPALARIFQHWSLLAYQAMISRKKVKIESDHSWEYLFDVLIRSYAQEEYLSVKDDMVNIFSYMFMLGRCTRYYRQVSFVATGRLLCVVNDILSAESSLSEYEYLNVIKICSVLKENFKSKDVSEEEAKRVGQACGALLEKDKLPEEARAYLIALKEESATKK